MRYLKSIKNRRVGFIDELRGLDIIAMVAYHVAYDLVFIFGVEIPFYRGPVMTYVQPVIAGIFIVLSGISCRYSRNNAKRGAKTLLLGMLLTAATLYFIPEEAIYFGILHFMGAAMLLYALLRPLLDKLPAFFGLIVSVVLFTATYNLPGGYLGVDGLYTFTLPTSLYANHYLLPIGFGGIGSDYFPLIPYIFLYFAGAYLGIFFIENAFPNWFYRTHSRFLSAIGRHTMIIYLLHQPVAMGTIWLIFLIMSKI